MPFGFVSTRTPRARARRFSIAVVLPNERYRTWGCAARTLGLLLALVPGLAGAVCVRNEPGTLWDFEGTLAAKLRVRMTLVFSGEQVEGVYFYANQLRDIPLKGHLSNAQNLVLDERDATGAVMARFVAHFPERDPGSTYGDSPLTCDVIVGTWQKLGGGAALPVYLTTSSAVTGSLDHRYLAALGVNDDHLINDGATRFWRAVKADDQPVVAAQIAYPIVLNVAGRRLRLKTPAELLSHYEAIFTEAFRATILKAMPRNLFVRDQGAMLGNGAVWFGANGKAIALSP